MVFWLTRVLLSAGIGINNIWALLNNVLSDKIASKLKGELGKRVINKIGCVHSYTEIFQACFEGLSLANGSAAEEIRDVFDSIISRNTSD
jgi:CO dehydrogenase nickel-insertion accessory protein CooC1